MATRNPLFGVNWTLNKGASVFSTNWTPDSETRLYEETSTGYKLQVFGVHQGKPYSWGYDAKYDGQDHAVTGRPDVDAIEAYKVNDRITIGFFKKGAALAGPYARKLSADGKTLTVQTVGKRDDGTVYFDVIEYKKP
jgi:hypothetical protein